MSPIGHSLTLSESQFFWSNTKPWIWPETRKKHGTTRNRTRTWQNLENHEAEEEMVLEGPEKAEKDKTAFYLDIFLWFIC